jgi:hypothetical protein
VRQRLCRKASRCEEPWTLGGTAEAPLSLGGCGSVLGSGRRKEAGHEYVHGWFSDNKEWIEFIIATVLLWLLMMTAIHELDLRSAA